MLQNRFLLAHMYKELSMSKKKQINKCIDNQIRNQIVCLMVCSHQKQVKQINIFFAHNYLL